MNAARVEKMVHSSRKIRVRIHSLVADQYKWDAKFYMKFTYLAVRTVLYRKQVEY
jgi:hypothetical protein